MFTDSTHLSWVAKPNRENLFALTAPEATSSRWACVADFTKAPVAAVMALAASTICSWKFRVMSASWCEQRQQ